MTSGTSRDLPLELGSRDDGPPFAQIRAGVLSLIAEGHLQPGERLPTVRELAGQLELAPNTVARAYRELEADGVLETRGRRGTFVALDGGRSEREAFAAACAYVERADRLGLEPGMIRELLERALVRQR